MTVDELQELADAIKTVGRIIGGDVAGVTTAVIDALVLQDFISNKDGEQLEQLLPLS